METEEIICERTLKGGLNTTVQIYQIKILPLTLNSDGTLKYTRKVSIRHGIVDHNEPPKSLRFDNPMAMIHFIGRFSKAYGRFKTKNNELQNYGYELAQLIEEVKKGFEEGVKMKS